MKFTLTEHLFHIVVKLCNNSNNMKRYNPYLTPPHYGPGSSSHVNTVDNCE